MGLIKNLAVQLQDEIMERITSSENGEINFLDTLVDLKEVDNILRINQQLIKEWEYDNREMIVEEAKDYPEGYRNYIIKEVNGRTTFNYKNIDAWKVAKAELRNIEAYYKSVFLNKIKGLNTVTEDGEIVDTFPEVNYTKNYIKMTKTKQ